eukprot:TRINITY_DN6719_c0_g4_i1.p1 TRINITY_DN6719_c0_g4~~TRINITY_DN6719_c0_g4_i1.p1  ORF type:complete len:435 (-),score=59.69 TRINITY_DN6719_c0_g4_i1:225-1355(-)
MGKAPGDDHVDGTVPFSQAKIVRLAKAVVGVVRALPGGRALIQESSGPLRKAVAEGSVQPIVPWMDLAEVDPAGHGFLVDSRDDAATATVEGASDGAVVTQDTNAYALRGSHAGVSPLEQADKSFAVGNVVHDLLLDSRTESMPLRGAAHLKFSVRDEVAVLMGLAKGGAINPEMLATWLGKGTLPKREDNMHREDLRLAYTQLWAERWLPQYFVAVSQRFHATPEAQRAEPGGKLYRGGFCVFRRRCGRFLVDAMRAFFTRELRLSGVEPGAIYNLVDAFARVLANDAEAKSRLTCCLHSVHDKESERRPMLIDAILKFAYFTLMINTEVTKVAPRNRKWTRSKVGKECEPLTHFPSSLCKQMFDTLAQNPLVIS